MRRKFNSGARCWKAALLGTTILSTMGPAFAQENRAAPITLETITVQGQREKADGPVDGLVATRSATGTKTDTPLIETPQSISVVTQDQIKVTGAQNPSEALRYTAGVQIERFGADPRYDWIKIRGFDAPEYLDGLALPKATFAWPRYELFGVERLEVLKGPASVLYGQSPPGGLVNFVSKKPLEERRNEIQFQAGNYGRWQAAFDFTGPVDPEKKLLYRLIGLGRLSDTIVDFVNDDRAFIAPSMTWRPTWDTTFTALGYYIKDDSKSLQFLPAQGVLYPNPNGPIPRNRFLGEPGYDDFQRTQFGIGYQFEHRFDEALTVRQNLRYGGTDVNLPVVRGFGFPARNGVITDYQNVTRRVVRFDDRVDAFTVDNQLLMKAQTGPLSHTILAGLDYRTFDVDSSTRVAPLSPNFNVFAPVYGRRIPNPPVIASVAQNLGQLGVYLQDQIKLDRFVVMLSGRHDWLDNSTTNRLNNTRIDQSDSAFTGRAGLLYHFDNGFAPYVSYSTLFQPAVGVGGGVISPTLGFTSSGTPFRPTTGDQIEAGIKYEPPGTDSLFTASVFRINQENVLVPDTANIGRQTQIGAVRVDGVEFEGKVNLWRGLDLLASYSYLASEMTQTSQAAHLGKELPITPHHQASAFINYTFDNGSFGGLSLGAGVRYVGSHYGDQANLLRIPSYTLVDAVLRYDLSRLDRRLAGAQFALNVNNIFDKVYVATCSDANTCYYGNPRTVLATLSYRW